jgi:Zn-dependent M28 family amino/carboxypeptidase
VRTIQPVLYAFLFFIFALTTQATELEYKNQQQLHDIQQQISAKRIEQDIRKLVGFGTRHTLSETKSDTRGIGAARRWFKSEFDAISKACGGCITVYFQSQTIQGEKRIPDATEVVSVIAVQTGTTDPNRYVMMSGDIDSRISDVMNFTDDSPGANDNASGVAGILEAARVLSQYQFNGSIVYAALAGEEQGLFGGKILAETAQKDGWRYQQYYGTYFCRGYSLHRNRCTSTHSQVYGWRGGFS